MQEAFGTKITTNNYSSALFAFQINNQAMSLYPYKGNGNKEEKIMQQKSSKKAQQHLCLRMISVLKNNQKSWQIKGEREVYHLMFSSVIIF